MDFIFDTIKKVGDIDNEKVNFRAIRALEDIILNGNIDFDLRCAACDKLDAIYKSAPAVKETNKEMLKDWVYSIYLDRDEI